jgi:hypothetical protein
MNPQSTIFMTLEYQHQQQQQQQQNPNKKQIMKQRIKPLRYCEICTKPLTMSGFFYYNNNSNEFHYFDSQPCRAKFKDKIQQQEQQEQQPERQRSKRIMKMIKVNCTKCDNEFEVWESKYKHAKKNYNGHIYCSRNCSKLYHHRFYDKFFWCDFCMSWIEQKKAIWINKPKRQYPTCPKISCNNNKLKTKSTNYKSKQQQQQQQQHNNDAEE